MTFHLSVHYISQNFLFQCLNGIRIVLLSEVLAHGKMPKLLGRMS